jgi:TRAP-type uncharacterized transport system substrate-binding protein
VRNGLGRKLVASLVLGVIAALLVSMLAVVLLGRPPKTFTLAAGQAGGMYDAFATALQEALATEGITVEVVETAGSIKNAELLRAGKADVGLIQSGTELLTDIGGATALAEVFYEPFWIFARRGVIDVVDGIPVLAGKRLAIGPAGSGTNATARALIDQTGSRPSPWSGPRTRPSRAWRTGPSTPPSSWWPPLRPSWQSWRPSLISRSCPSRTRRGLRAGCRSSRR